MTWNDRGRRELKKKDAEEYDGLEKRNHDECVKNEDWMKKKG